MSMEYVGTLTVETPILAGMAKKYFDIRVFRRGEQVVVLNKYSIEKTIEFLETYKAYLESIDKRMYNELVKIYKSGNDPEKVYDDAKEVLLHYGFQDMDYLFPRNFITGGIDYYKTLVRPIYYSLVNGGGWGGVHIKEVEVVNAKVGYYISYIGKTKSPVGYETIEPTSRFEFKFLADREGQYEFKSQIGRSKLYGFGRCLFQIKKVGARNKVLFFYL
jgi:hypothetical protein